MKERIKVIITHTHTKMDINGNIYHTATVTNPANGQRFVTSTASPSNARSCVFEQFNYSMFEVQVPTQSARIDSLPMQTHRTEDCHFGEGWKKALREIGYRFSKEVTA